MDNHHHDNDHHNHDNHHHNHNYNSPEEILKRINSHKGIAGTVITNADGIPLRTTLDNASTMHYSQLQLVGLVCQGTI